MELGQQTYDMTKVADGFWEVTTKPLLPGFHYYAISVDGFVSNDPGSRTFFAARQEVSGLEVPAPESDFFAAKDVPHGTVRTEWYRSKITGESRRIFVYTPQDTIVAFHDIRFCTFSMGSARMKPLGAIRDMRISSWTT